MMYPYPLFGSYKYRRPYYSYTKPPSNINKSFTSNDKNAYSPRTDTNRNQKNIDCSSSFIENSNLEINNNENTEYNSGECFEIFGLKLYFDDLLIIALLFFLYQEDVKDNYLYIILILLLLG